MQRDEEQWQQYHVQMHVVGMADTNKNEGRKVAQGMMRQVQQNKES